MSLIFSLIFLWQFGFLLTLRQCVTRTIFVLPIFKCKLVCFMGFTLQGVILSVRLIFGAIYGGEQGTFVF